MLRLADLVKDKSTLDITRICSAWSWLLHAQEDVLHVSSDKTTRSIGLKQVPAI
jgi:hypothetical protein